MLIEIAGNQGLRADQPNVTNTLDEEEDPKLIDTVKGTKLHEVCRSEETEDWK